MIWEANEAAMALIEGRKEGQYEGLDESVVIMDVMNGLVYPDNIEAMTWVDPRNLNFTKDKREAYTGISNLK